MKKKLTGFLIFCLLLCGIRTMAFAAEKEEFPYAVTVNLTDNIVTVYEQDADGEYTVPLKAFLCSVGEDTPEGTFCTMAKYDWRYLFGDVWGQYATRITGHYLFHSVPYLEQDKNTLEYEEYNKLGTTASMGCIRLTVKDAKWIYDHCPTGTTVTMYRGEVEEPLQPAAVQKLDVNDEVRRGWDPTDPDPSNPWRKGELRKMLVEPSFLESVAEAYYENGTYYISPEDANALFSRIGIRTDFTEAETVEEELSIVHQGKEYHLSCRNKDGKSYLKLREAAAAAGAEMMWDKETKMIHISHDKKEITLSRLPMEQKMVSLTEKITELFRG